jgi:molybdate transport system substrate-binding protein
VRPLAIATCLAAALLVVAGCGGGAGSDASRLTVFAAASLTEAFPHIDPGARFSFAGSDTLAQQIQQGAPADVFASASPKYADDLFRRGLVERPVPLAVNRLTLIVPRSNPADIHSVADLRRSGVSLVVADEKVPVGSYTRSVLSRLGLSGVLSHVVSEEPDVKGVVGKVVLGQADAGFVYTTDARAAGDQVVRVPIPPRAQPDVRYEIAVVSSSAHPEAARAFVARATGPAGRRAMTAAGFILPTTTAASPG